MRSHKKNKSTILAVFMVGIVLVATCFLTVKAIDLISYAGSIKSTSRDNQLKIENIKSQNIYSQNVALIDAETGDVVYKKDSTKKCYPASLTKIMTAIVVIENTSNLNEKASIDSDMLTPLYAQNASMTGHIPGESVKVKDLLYGCLLASGADSCMGLAKYTAGSESNFVEMMNDKAKELGMKNTHFVNTTGLHDENHYSTAEDIGMLLKYAIENKQFKKIFTSKSHRIKTDQNDITVESTFFSKFDPADKDYEIDGAKTGRTEKAGLCLATFANKNHKKLILVTMNAPIGEGEETPFCIGDADYIYDSL